MAQILAFLDIAPFPRNLESLDKAAREWERGFGKMTNKVDDSERAFASARRGARDVAAQGEGIRPSRNRVSQGIDNARPVAEIGKARAATENGPGVSKKISKAEETSENPSAHVPDFDPENPLRSLDPQLNALARERERLNRERERADGKERQWEI